MIIKTKILDHGAWKILDKLANFNKCVRNINCEGAKARRMWPRFIGSRICANQMVRVFLI